MKFRTLLTAGAITVGLGATVLAYGFDGQQYRHEAHVSLAQARQIALRVLPGGKIASQELERERGGSGLRYSFDIAVAHGLREVGVDAKSGAVLENSVEGPNKD